MTTPTNSNEILAKHVPAEHAHAPLEYLATLTEDELLEFAIRLAKEPNVPADFRWHIIRAALDIAASKDPEGVQRLCRKFAMKHGAEFELVRAELEGK